MREAIKERLSWRPDTMDFDEHAEDYAARLIEEYIVEWFFEKKESKIDLAVTIAQKDMSKRG